jgi:NDP-sugar pyrophosphorylase family protein
MLWSTWDSAAKFTTALTFATSESTSLHWAKLLGPYTSIGDNGVITGWEIENAIIVGDWRIECGKRIVHSLIGRNAHITDSANTLSRGIHHWREHVHVSICSHRSIHASFLHHDTET